MRTVATPSSTLLTLDLHGCSNCHTRAGRCCASTPTRSFPSCQRPCRDSRRTTRTTHRRASTAATRPRGRSSSGTRSSLCLELPPRARGEAKAARAAAVAAVADGRAAPPPPPPARATTCRAWASPPTEVGQLRPPAAPAAPPGAALGWRSTSARRAAAEAAEAVAALAAWALHIRAWPRPVRRWTLDHRPLPAAAAWFRSFAPIVAARSSPGSSSALIVAVPSSSAPRQRSRNCGDSWSRRIRRRDAIRGTFFIEVCASTCMTNSSWAVST
mmetsp:Transcript_75307/g.211157  ORF Transcript_75307/g.211157 Transcript_75307/m.211157 type:complete len:272 (-) Transcript_75307:77-892(-)